MSKTYLSFVLLFTITFGFGQSPLINQVKFEGTKRTKVSFVKKFIDTKAGSILDSLQMNKDVVRLKKLPSVTHAYYQTYKSENGGYDVIYIIEENFTLIPFANLYSSTNDDFAFRIGLEEFNLFGKNITLGGFYQYDVFHSYVLRLRAPYLFSKKLGMSLTYNDITTQEPVYFNNTTADYKYRFNGFEFMGLYELNYKNRVELGFSLFTEDYQYLFGATQEDIPQALNVDKHLFKFIFSHEDIEYYYQYLNGFRSTLNMQYVKSSDANLPDFLLGFNDFVFYKRVGQRGNWANRLRLGLASNMETPFAPFSVDNNLNIRGVGNRIDRGTAAIVFNTEYRYSLIDKDWFVLQSNLFIDGGSWRNPGGDLSDFGDNENIRIYPGVGVRFIHKRIFNAVFRIDYGYGITKNPSRGFVFGIGQYF